MNNYECKVLVFQNGVLNNRRCEEIPLTKGIPIKMLIDLVRQKFQIRYKRIRLFNHEGVELYQEDLPYLKNKQILYFSKGEDFDARSSFGEYEIIKDLGEGGFAKVILGQHRTSGDKVAIKIVNTSQIGNAEQIDMVFREAEMLKSLHHRNIVKIHNCYTLPNMEVVFVMEYLQGGELLQYVIDKVKLTEQEACFFFVQIVEGIQYCHAQKLIHRDLKLENILLAEQDGELIKIVDFGIAGLANMGTLRYMPPEVLSGKVNEISYPIDVWALGIILFGMVAGRLPFDGETLDETMELIIKVKYQFPEEVSVELKDLLSRIFISDPYKRITVNKILEHQWLLKNYKGQNSATAYKIFVQQQNVQTNPTKSLAPIKIKKKNKKKVGIDFVGQQETTSIPKHPKQVKQLTNPTLQMPSSKNKRSISSCDVPSLTPNKRSYTAITQKKQKNTLNLFPSFKLQYNILDLNHQLKQKKLMLNRMLPGITSFKYQTQF